MRWWWDDDDDDCDCWLLQCRRSSSDELMRKWLKLSGEIREQVKKVHHDHCYEFMIILVDCALCECLCSVRLLHKMIQWIKERHGGEKLLAFHLIFVGDSWWGWNKKWLNGERKLHIVLYNMVHLCANVRVVSGSFWFLSITSTVCILRIQKPSI